MNIGTIIPQIFYDLIARITPGLMLILSGIVVWRGNRITGEEIDKVFEKLAKENSPVLLTLFFLLFSSYVLAFVLDGMWGFLPKRPFQDKGKGLTDEILLDFKKLNPEFNRVTYEFPSIALRYDAIRIKDANAGARLAKLRAELHMLRVFILGLSILAILNIKNLFHDSSSGSVISQALIIIAIYSFWRTGDRLNDRFIWGTCNHWLLLVKPGILAETKTDLKERGSALAAPSPM
jgi:hypothetical protein